MHPNEQIRILIRTIYSITEDLEEAYDLVERLYNEKIDDFWDNVREEYMRVCVNCGKSYVVGRTNMPEWGLCPECDTHFHQDELARVKRQNRRAVRENKPATLTFREWMKTIRDFNGKCAYCLKEEFTDMEHFVPIKKGGGTTADNVLPSCSSCNWRKRSRDPRRTKKLRIPQKEIRRIKSYLKSRRP